MSGIIEIRAALEVALNSMAPAVATAWENVMFNPPASSVPYQSAFLMMGEPDNREWGGSHIEEGILQVSLMYPLQKGTAEANARAEYLRTVFFKGATFTKDGVKVNIVKTPTIGQGRADGDRWFIPVKIRFHSFIS